MLHPDSGQAKTASTKFGVRRLHVSAFGIHTGGGLVLLKALLEAARGVLAHVSLDDRLRGSYEALNDWESSFVRRSFLARAYDSLSNSARVGPADTLLCFNSLPPLRSVRGHVITYVHAPHFVGLHRGTRYRRLTALRLVIERTWFRMGAHNSDEFWVQTESMCSAIRLQNPNAKVEIVPFVDEFLHDRLGPMEVSSDLPAPDYASYCFVYPAECVGHKNHATLLAAWATLAGKGVFPRLVLSLNEAELGNVLFDARMARLPNVEAMGPLERSAVLELLSRSSALVFPSLAETYGLPLLEARAMHIPIIASERDFVRDVCIPTQTFDPTSARSIARALLRFMDGTVELRPCLSAEQFTNCLLQ